MTDNLSPEQRLRCMRSVKSKNTSIETRVRSLLHRQGLRFRKHVKDLPGKPDVVFTRAKIVVFINGDFWHGYRYKKWVSRLSEYWRGKIAKNRARDCKNLLLLRKSGWRVILVWEHEVKEDADQVAEKIKRAYISRLSRMK